MRKVMCTSATNGYEKLLAITQPAMQEYANEHGYHLVTNTHEGSIRDCPRMLGWKTGFDRGLHWYKVPLIAYLFQHLGAEQVLWIDADALILDTSKDLADEIPVDSWQSLIFYDTVDGQDPGTGIWFLDKPMLPFLRRLWEESPDHGEEDTALRKMMGCDDSQSPREFPRPGEANCNWLVERTHRLGHEWGWIERDRYPSLTPRVFHAVCRPLEERVRTLELIRSLNNLALVEL